MCIRDRFIAGTDDGELHIVTKEFALEKRQDKGHYRNKLISTRIVGLSWVIEGKVIALIGTDNFLKLFDVSALKVVGGGSLNKRLEGGSVTAMDADTSYRLFLATNKGRVMCYQVDPSTCKPSFVYSIALSAEFDKVSVGAMLLSCNNLFLACGSQILAYNVGSKTEPKNVLHELTVVCFVLAAGEVGGPEDSVARIQQQQERHHSRVQCTAG
eukprot:TRINITY_DN9655_c0_g3_i2.p1 TRINITY_DN9655_c0_g3~~TRINITY_DN9655_c0_g3_i2.p1  ORF type:complete len:213 (-),score=36.57 TRINITY_DN9655_c0_g3_i2:336-974(-)